ncbi:unnamed protein product, partial [Laminaria digitata]
MSSTRRSNTVTASHNPSHASPSQPRSATTATATAASLPASGPSASAVTSPQNSDGSSCASIQAVSVQPSGPTEFTVATARDRVVNFCTRDVVLRLVEREPIIVVINGFALKDYLRSNLTVWFCRAPPDSVRKVIPTNSWVVQATSPTSALAVAREIKSAVSLASDHDDHQPQVKISRVRLTSQQRT